MDFGIKNSLELYKRLSPAINCKIRELKKFNIDYVKKDDIWNYLMQTKWNKERGITLAEMVDDILNLDNEKLDMFAKRKLKSVKSEIELEEVELL